MIAAQLYDFIKLLNNHLYPSILKHRKFGGFEIQRGKLENLKTSNLKLTAGFYNLLELNDNTS